MSQSPSTSVASPNKIFIPKELHTPKKDVPGISKTVFTHVSTLRSSLEDWSKMQEKGTKICKVISTLNLHEYKEDFYPPKLGPLTETLVDVLESLQQSVENIKTVTNQLKAITQLHPGNQPVIFTWSSNKLYEEVKNISESLQKELKLKGTITENLAHTRDKGLIEVYISSWEFDIYYDMDSWSYLFAEFGLNSIT